ncbi:TetR/AcrR family transcriptional regulator [Spiractinospora alimapuensis]|uniref:TetR/AcrR family transcriptional regulator n=1 Tax=Spiractinospora alimapuensis TaxID=2820884 RepID=UPI001F2C52C9|nr:TetR/AcrR family transcriptional regulator [Spiractinospora alimapuensis]QVQ50037.1 TetR/AcrR family transcriptional regulator [Spiractinospora alimapuensis]
MSDKRNYHYGNLRAAVLERAARVIEERGPDGFSLRSLAADLGVSHTAPRHHFGSRTGVFTALATEGHNGLAARVRESREQGGGFLEAGVAYVQYAVEHPAHFHVMFAPTLLDSSDPELAEAKRASFQELQAGATSTLARENTDDAPAVALAGWAIAHGIATLALSGNLDSSGIRTMFAEQDLASITRRSAGQLFSSRPSPEEEP